MNKAIEMKNEQLSQTPGRLPNIGSNLGNFISNHNVITSRKIEQEAR